MTAPLARKRLLLVGEDADLAALVASAASRLGADVAGVRTGAAADDRLSARAPDVAVMDLPLADVRGSELVARFVAAGVPVLVVSGVYRGSRATDEVRRMGATDFFEKPFQVDALLAAVARAVGAVTAEVVDEVPDEVTGARPLGREEVLDGIAASLLPFGDDEAPASARTAQDGLATALPEAARRKRRAEAAPPTTGDLAETSVPRLLVALHVGQATGALTIARGPVRKILVVERGVPVYAASNVGAERFSSLAVRRGAVTPEAIETLRRAAPDERTGEALVARGLLSPETRLELLSGQVRAIVWSTFEWREGSYAFQLGRPPASRVALELPMADLVLDGMRRASTLPRLRAELGPDVHLAPSPDPAFELYALKLKRGEAKLLALADGTKGVADLVRLADVEEKDAFAFLQACRVMRVLDEVERVLASTRRIGFM
jgi:CheY-like chemotaxis protein